MTRKKIIIILLTLTLTTITIKKTYSYYISRTSVNVKASSSDVKCDAEITNVSETEKNKFGYSEFKVVVKNYDNQNNLTNENFNYVLSIENSNESNGLFGYNNQFNNRVEITDSMSNNAQNSKSYIFQVKTEDGQSKNISYKVNLKCIQSN